VSARYPHTIRLRGPWECEPLEPAGPVRRVSLPCRWGEGGLAGLAGRVRFRRRFGYPGRIDADERVWLTFAGVRGSAVVALNGHPLGRHQGTFAFEVTGLLAARNEVVVEVDVGGDEPWAEVALEVRRTAYLRDVHVEVSGEALTVRAAVVGTAERPLDLYALLGRSTVAYATVSPEPGGVEVVLRAETIGRGEGETVRVELVDGATVWYAVELLLGEEQRERPGP
jgi:hypothetical protein